MGQSIRKWCECTHTWSQMEVKYRRNIFHWHRNISEWNKLDDHTALAALSSFNQTLAKMEIKHGWVYVWPLICPINSEQWISQFHGESHPISYPVSVSYVCSEEKLILFYRRLFHMLARAHWRFFLCWYICWANKKWTLTGFLTNCIKMCARKASFVKVECNTRNITKYVMFYITINILFVSVWRHSYLMSS